MSALTVVETDLACERGEKRRRRVTTRQSPHSTKTHVRIQSNPIQSNPIESNRIESNHRIDSSPDRPSARRPIGRAHDDDDDDDDDAHDAHDRKK